MLKMDRSHPLRNIMLPTMVVTCKKVSEATHRDPVPDRGSAAVTLRHVLLAAVMTWATLLAAGSAHATIICSLSASGFTSVYDPTSTVPNDNVSRVTINCNRASGDPATTTYSLAVTNGLYPNGQNNRAYYPTNKYLKYDVYKDAAYSSRWGASGGSPITGTLNFGSGTFASVTLPYYNRVGALQSAVVGDYTDTMTTTLTYSVTSVLNATTTATMPVIITTNSQCQFSTPPGTMSLSYTSFQATAATGSTQFATRCTSGLPYTMSLGATGGTLMGLNYSLSLSASNGTGTGAAQTYSVNGSIAANQVGVCATSACTASAPQTITISY